MGFWAQINIIVGFGSRAGDRFWFLLFFSPLGFLVGKGKTGDGEQREWLKGNR